MSERKKLFAEFPPVTTEQWMEKITADLKGADFEKRLVWRTNEGFNVKPFYRQEDIEKLSTTNAEAGKFPFLRGVKNDNTWFVRQDISVKDAATANAKALDILGKGVNSIGFIVPSGMVNKETVDTLLKGICLECVEVNFSTCRRTSTQLAEIFVAYVAANNIDPMKVQGSINFDPFKGMLKKGKDAPEFAQLCAQAIEVVKGLPFFRILAVNANLLSNAGSYITQELGFALAQGNEYLRQLTENGMPSVLAAKNIKFNFGVSSNYFMEIAKFRAARLLWAKIVAAYNPVCTRDCENNGPNKECRCASKLVAHAITSEWNMTVYDAHVNLLRTQTEAMSAVLGGVNSLTVLPFDVAYKASDDFSERIARNQQLLLKEESYFDKILDPSAGSYYIENLTVSIAEQAWKLFLEIEEKGGFYTAVKEGFIQSEIAKAATARAAAVASRKEILLGSNQFPNFTEVASTKISDESDSCGCKNNCEKTIQPLSFTRGAEQFEVLRMATEKSGKRPKVFMLTIGSLAMRLARSQFASNFFACAGYEIIDNLGFDTVEAGVEAARKAKADIIVLCSSDDEYAELAPQAKNAMGGGKEILVVAGMPASMEDLKAQGITNFINVRSNVLETLKEFNSKLL
jgi:methylmalonyl-CoA mutase